MGEKCGYSLKGKSDVRTERHFHTACGWFILMLWAGDWLWLHLCVFPVNGNIIQAGSSRCPGELLLPLCRKRCQCLIPVTGLHIAQGQLQTEAQADSPGGLQGTEGDSCQLWQLQDWWLQWERPGSADQPGRHPDHLPALPQAADPLPLHPQGGCEWHCILCLHQIRPRWGGLLPDHPSCCVFETMGNGLVFFSWLCTHVRLRNVFTVCFWAVLAANRYQHINWKKQGRVYSITVNEYRSE